MKWNRGDSMVFKSTEGLKFMHDQNKKQSIFVLDTDYKDSRHLLSWKYHLRSFGTRKCYENVNGAHRAVWTIYVENNDNGLTQWAKHT